MNKVELIGRLTKDPEVSYKNDSPYGRYTLAVDRKVRKDNNDPNVQTADFISCVVFNKNAQFAEQYLHKGMKIAVAGRIQTGKYTNKEGQTIYTTDVVVEEHEFIESKNASGGGNVNNNSNAGSGSSSSRNSGGGFSGGYQNPQQSFMNIPEGVNEQLPFT